MGVGYIKGARQERNRDAIEYWIAECHGNLLKTSHYLGLSRRRVYQVVESLGLWPLVNAARVRRVEIKRKENQ